MCNEKQTIAAAVGDGAKAVVAKDSPILRVDDPRLDDTSDPNMQKRRRVLAILGNQLPMAWQYDEVTKKKIESPYEQGPYKNNMSWYKPKLKNENSCTSVNVRFLRHFAGASGNWGYGIEGKADASTGWKVLSPQTGWVKYRPGLLPSVGDVFILYIGTMAHHCGIVCQASLDPKGFWITGDGGQPDRAGQLHKQKDGRWVRSYNTPDADYPPDATSDLVAWEAGYFVPRKLDCTDPQNPLISNFFTGGWGETLHGWRNVGHKDIKFKNNAEYDSDGSKEDYERAKKAILRVDELAKKEAFDRTLYYPEEL